MDTQTHQKHVLLVDDDKIVRTAHRYPLIAAGFTVEEAESGQQAIEYFKRYRNVLSMVLLDYHMPDMTGAALTKALRDIEKHESSIPIIGVTSHSDEDIRAICLNAGMTDIYCKPLLQTQLLSLLQQF